MLQALVPAIKNAIIQEIWQTSKPDFSHGQPVTQSEVIYKRGPVSPSDNLLLFHKLRYSTDLGSPTQLRLSFRRARLVLVTLLSLCVRLHCLARCKRLLEVMNDIVDVFRTNRDTDQVLCYTTVALFLVRKLLVGCSPWVDRQRLRIADTAIMLAWLMTRSRLKWTILCQIRDHLESIHDLTPSCSSTLDTKGQHPASSSREILFRQLV